MRPTNRRLWAFLDLDSFYHSCASSTGCVDEHDVMVNFHGQIISCSLHSQTCHGVVKMSKDIPEGINSVLVTYEMRVQYGLLFQEVLRVVRSYYRRAYEWRKDSVIFRVLPAQVEDVKSAVLSKTGLLCTIGIDETRQDARAQCMLLKQEKKLSMN